MKHLKLAFILSLMSAILIAAQSTDRIQTYLVVTTAIDEPVQVGTNGYRAFTYVFTGLKNSRTNNTSTVWIQFGPQTNAEPNQVAGIPLEPGQVISITENNKGLPDTLFWIAAETIGDGATVTAIE